MKSNEDDPLAQIREAAHDLAVSSGQKLIGQWQDLKINPLISCIALIRMAYTQAPASVTGAANGPDQFAELCKLVASKDGVLDGKLFSHDNAS